MALRHESIDVRVSRRILWFGSEAYPLHNITRTNTLVITPNRGSAIKRYLISIALWLIPPTVASAAGLGFVTALAVVGWLALVVYKTIKLVEFLKLTLYELVIETAAGSHRGLVTANENVVFDLSIRITDAINNPHAEFQMRVENLRVGDDINMYGDHNTGKVAR
jgi:hypothetical protein